MRQERQNCSPDKSARRQRKRRRQKRRLRVDRGAAAYPDGLQAPRAAGQPATRRGAAGATGAARDTARVMDGHTCPPHRQRVTTRHAIIINSGAPRDARAAGQCARNSMGQRNRTMTPETLAFCGEGYDKKRRQLFIRTHNETLSVVAMCVNNPDCSPV